MERVRGFTHSDTDRPFVAAFFIPIYSRQSFENYLKSYDLPSRFTIITYYTQQENPYPINKFLELASTRIPNLCGMKYTDYNSLVMGLCLDACDGKYTILMGREDVGVLAPSDV